MAETNKYTIIGIIFILVVFGGVIYYVTDTFSSQCSSGQNYNEDLKKCVDSCDSGKTFYKDLEKCLSCQPGKTFYSGVCHTDCTEKESKCGTKCYSDSQMTCVDETLCLHENVCEILNENYNAEDDENTESETITTCCPRNQECDAENKKCADCTGLECGDECCSGGEKCLNGGCCDLLKIGKNSAGYDICCANELCNGICCGGTTTCSDGVCKVPCGEFHCDELNNEICNTISLTGEKRCYRQNCRSDSQVYDPPLIDNANTSGDESLPTCKDEFGKIYIINNPKGFSGELSRSASVEFNRDNDCSEMNCNFKMAEHGITGTPYDRSTGLCTGEFNCSTLLNSHNHDDDELVCPLENPHSCCRNTDGKFTGQVCNYGDICLDGECIAGWECNTNTGCEKSYIQNDTLYTNKVDCELEGCRTVRSGDLVKLIFYLHHNETGEIESKYYIQDGNTVKGKNILLDENITSEKVMIYATVFDEADFITDGTEIDPSVHDIVFALQDDSKIWFYAKSTKFLKWKKKTNNNGKWYIYTNNYEKTTNTVLYYNQIIGMLHCKASADRVNRDYLHENKPNDVLSLEKDSEDSDDEDGLYSMRIRDKNQDNPSRRLYLELEKID